MGHPQPAVLLLTNHHLLWKWEVIFRDKNSTLIIDTDSLFCIFKFDPDQSLMQNDIYIKWNGIQILKC